QRGGAGRGGGGAGAAGGRGGRGWRAHGVPAPPQRRASIEKPRRRQPVEASRIAAMSGTRPTMKKTVLTERYVEIANTSQTSGDRKFGQRKRWFGDGSRKYANHIRPAWISGNRPAVMTAKIVIASAPR